MQSNNPVFRRSEEFHRGGNAYGNQMYAGNGASYPGYGQPGSTGLRTPGTPTDRAGRMTHRLGRAEDRHLARRRDRRRAGDLDPDARATEHRHRRRRPATRA